MIENSFVLFFCIAAKKSSRLWDGHFVYIYIRRNYEKFATKSPAIARFRRLGSRTYFADVMSVCSASMHSPSVCTVTNCNAKQFCFTAAIQMSGSCSLFRLYFFYAISADFGAIIFINIASSTSTAMLLHCFSLSVHRFFFKARATGCQSVAQNRGC